MRAASGLHSLVQAGSLVALLGGLASFTKAASSGLLTALLAGRAGQGSLHRLAQP
jgi:hypothetical protein